MGRSSVPNSRIALPVFPPRRPSCRVLVTGRGSHQSHVLTRDIPGEMRLWLLTSVARPRITRFEYSLSDAARLCLVANCIDTEVRGGAGIFSCVREVLVVKVVSF